jgi:hypothetical protein
MGERMKDDGYCHNISLDNGVNMILNIMTRRDSGDIYVSSISGKILRNIEF